MRNSAKTLLLMLLLPMAGCSIIGQSESSCPGKPNGYVCKATARRLRDDQQQRFAVRWHSGDGLDDDEDEDGKKTGATGDEAVPPDGAVVEIPAAGVIPSNSLSLYRDDFSAPEPMAVRADARILRVLFAAYEDDAQSLNMPGYAFVEVEPSSSWLALAANPATLIIRCRPAKMPTPTSQGRWRTPSTRWV